MKSRTGLRIRGSRGHREVRPAILRFAAWLRRNYHFPIRVPVYLFPGEWIVTCDGERVTASFFAPWDRNVEPFIRIATGDYPSLKRARGRDNALAAILISFAHEVLHYRQWVETGEVWERGVVRQASAMVRRYAMTVDHP